MLQMNGLRRQSEYYAGLKARLVPSAGGAAPAEPGRRLMVLVWLVVVASAAGIIHSQQHSNQQLIQLLHACQGSGSSGVGGAGQAGNGAAVALEAARGALSQAVGGAPAAASEAAAGPAAAKAAAAAAAAAPLPGAAVAKAAAVPEGDNYAAFCLLVRGDHRRIREWVAYHWSIGVTKFYIYDDNSDPPLEATLKDFMNAGVVSYRHLETPIGSPHQTAAYDDCIKQHRDKHGWLGFLDSDEFLVIRDGSPNIQSVLKRYEDFGGLVVSWRWYGSSGHVAAPKGLILESFTACGPKLHDHVKTIVNARHVAGPSSNPHAFAYKKGYFAVNTNRTAMPGHAYPNVNDPVTHPVDDVLVINHYVVRSLEEFKFKMSRGSAMKTGKTMPFFEFVEKETTANCTYAIPLGERVRQQLALLPPAA